MFLCINLFILHNKILSKIKLVHRSLTLHFGLYGTLHLIDTLPSCALHKREALLTEA